MNNGSWKGTKINQTIIVFFISGLLETKFVDLISMITMPYWQLDSLIWTVWYTDVAVLSNKDAKLHQHIVIN